MADLNKMNNQELVETLGSIKWHQITDLFQFNEDAKVFIKIRKMQVIIDELAHRGSTFTKDDSKGIQTFTEVLRSAFYLAFYNNELSELNERSFQDKCLPALKAIAKIQTLSLVQMNKIQSYLHTEN